MPTISIDVMQMVGTRSLSSGARSRDPVALPTLRLLQPRIPFSLKYFSAPGWNGIGERS